MSEATWRPKVRAFLSEMFPAVSAKRLADDAPLLESGLIDSLGILRIVAHLDKEFSIALQDDDLSPENFGSVERISRFLAQKSAQ